MSHPPLFIWLGSDPLAGPPDMAIEDVPGVSDLELLVQAITTGRLGRLLPSRIAISPHDRPHPHAFRAIDVGRLLREHRIPHRQRFELLSFDESSE